MKGLFTSTPSFSQFLANNAQNLQKPPNIYYTLTRDIFSSYRYRNDRLHPLLKVSGKSKVTSGLKCSGTLSTVHFTNSITDLFICHGGFNNMTQIIQTTQTQCDIQPDLDSNHWNYGRPSSRSSPFSGSGVGSSPGSMSATVPLA